MKTYRVKAVWRTLQGEGFFAGRPAVFVRFVGCNMWSGEEEHRERDAARHGADCPLWCDTDFRKGGSRALIAEDLVTEMKQVGGEIRFCVLTGGEPFLQADADLIGELHRAGFLVAVETNGTIALRDAFQRRIGNGRAGAGDVLPPDWIVCSPKLPEGQLHLEYCDELKLVVPDYRPEDYASFSRSVCVHSVGIEQRPLLWLQPEDGPRFAEATREAVALALQHPEWRVSTQTHKVLGVE